MSDSLPNRMLQLMSDGEWHSTKELINKISHRFSATMHVLRKRGYEFEKRPLQGQQQYEYRIVMQ